MLNVAYVYFLKEVYWAACGLCAASRRSHWKEHFHKHSKVFSDLFLDTGIRAVFFVKCCAEEIRRVSILLNVDETSPIEDFGYARILTYRSAVC